MIPSVGLSVATIACALERGWLWFQLLGQEDKIVHDVLAAAHVDLDKAVAIDRISSPVAADWTVSVATLEAQATFP